MSRRTVLEHLDPLNGRRHTLPDRRACGPASRGCCCLAIKREFVPVSIGINCENRVAQIPKIYCSRIGLEVMNPLMLKCTGRTRGRLGVLGSFARGYREGPPSKRSGLMGK